MTADRKTSTPASEAARLTRWGTAEWRTACGRFRFDGFYVWTRYEGGDFFAANAREPIGEARCVRSAQELIDRYLDELATDVLLGRGPNHGGPI